MLNMEQTVFTFEGTACIWWIFNTHILHSTKAHIPANLLHIVDSHTSLKKANNHNQSRKQKVVFFFLHSEVKENPEQVTELQAEFAKILLVSINLQNPAV